MNPKRESTRTDERGIALMSVVLLMLVVSALTAALAVSAQTEVLVSRNHQSAAQAHMAAEAGLNHAASTVVANLARWEANGFATSSAAMSRLLRGPDDLNGTAPTDLDNGSLEVLGIPRSPARTALGTMPGVAYEARIFDEDDPLRGVTLAPTDLARIQENAVATADNNRRLVVRATGYALNGTRVVLDAIVGTVTLPAVVTNGDLTVNGNPTVIGLAGGIHSNEDLELLGSPSIAQQATASLDYSTTGNPVVGGELGGSFPHLWIPPVKASDYRWRADFILTAGGLITTNPDARPLPSLCCAMRPPSSTRAAPRGGGSIEGRATAGTSPATAAQTVRITSKAPRTFRATPCRISSPWSSPLSRRVDRHRRQSGPEGRHPGTPVVTDGDLKIAGVLGIPLDVEGQMLVHEQIMIVGNPTLAGQILVEDAVDISPLVTSNQISGNATISYNGTIGANIFAVISW